MKKIEQAIQKALVVWMREICLTMTAYPFSWSANFNEFARHAIDMGMDVGSSDLLLRQRRGSITHFLYLELKRKNGTLSESQIEWNVEFDAHYASDNCKRAVAYGFDDAKEIVLSWLS